MKVTKICPVYTFTVMVPYVFELDSNIAFDKLTSRREVERADLKKKVSVIGEKVAPDGVGVEVSNVYFSGKLFDERVRYRAMLKIEFSWSYQNEKRKITEMTDFVIGQVVETFDADFVVVDRDKQRYLYSR
ncbi:hypothetical protein ACFL2R_02865 [Patescibacteria group bacterium]